MDPTGQETGKFRFTHTLSSSGGQITTADDPQIGRMNGIGQITDALQAAGGKDWRVAFRTENPNQSRSCECRWERKEDELFIVRKDWLTRPVVRNVLATELKLRRAAERAP
jgi:hypothetical protein